MRANVYGQRTSLYKALYTAQMNAAVWSLIRMYPVMSLEVRFAVETLVRWQSAFCQLDFRGAGKGKKHMTKIRLPLDNPLARNM